MENINVISESINQILNQIISSIDNKIYPLLDDIIFIKQNITEDLYINKMLGEGQNKGILLIVNTIFVGILIYYAIDILIKTNIYENKNYIFKIIFRIFISIILVNNSLFICNIIIEFFSNIGLAIRNIGEQIFNKNICFTELINKINSVIYISEIENNIFSLEGILKSLTSISLINLMFSYSLRYIIIKVLIIISPFAFMGIAIEQFSWIYKKWIKTLVSAMSIQILVSIILLIIYSIDFNEDIFSKIIYIGGIYGLINANKFINEFIGGINMDVNTGIYNMRRGNK